MSLPPETRRAAKLLLATTWVVVAVCVAVLLFAVLLGVLIKVDGADETRGLDVGSAIVIAVASFFLPLLVACGALLAVTSKGLRAEDAARLHTAGRTAVIACAALALLGLVQTRSMGSIALLVAVFPALVLAVPSALLASRTAPERRG